MADERVSGAAAEVGSIVDRRRLFDDTFMEMFFKDNIPAKEGEGRKQMCKLIEDYAKDYAQKREKAAHAEGREEGRSEGLSEGKIINTIEMGIELGWTQDDIVSRLKDKFPLTEDEAMRYYCLYSNAPAV